MQLTRIARHRALASSVAASLILGGGALAVASVSTPASARPAYQSTTYVAHDEPGNLAFDDLGAPSPHGPELGDVLAFTQRLTHGGKTVGRVSNSAIGVDQKRHRFQATGTIVLAHGSVDYAGLVSLGSHFVMGVTGGTGRYIGARGTVTFDNVHEVQKLTVRLAR